MQHGCTLQRDILYSRKDREGQSGAGQVCTMLLIIRVTHCIIHIYHVSITNST
jgi:hypothetical protein